MRATSTANSRALKGSVYSRPCVLVDSDGRIFAIRTSFPAGWLVIVDGVEKALDDFAKGYLFKDSGRGRGMQNSADYGNNMGGGREVRSQPLVNQGLSELSTVACLRRL